MPQAYSDPSRTDSPTERFYLISWHETDGNDCTVFDSIVTADSEDAARSKLADAIEAELAAKGTEFVSDGDFGLYFACDCDIPEAEADSWECSHGGIVQRDAEAFDTLEQATEAKAPYHLFWDATTESEAE